MSISYFGFIFYWRVQSHSVLLSSA